MTLPGRTLAAICAAAFAFASADLAFACACCTNTGQRKATVEKLDSGKLDEIRRLRFADTARLFLGEADADSVKGITSPSERYALQVIQQKDRLVFELRDQSGRSGTLSLLQPASISIFEIDPRDNAGDGVAARASTRNGN